MLAVFPPALTSALTTPTPRATRRDAIGLVTAAAGSTLLGTPGLARPAAATGAAAKLALPTLGLGAWAWGDTLFWGYDSKKDGDLAEVFDYAVDQGITFFDTAEVYGLGRSETLLGEFAARSAASDKIQVATKFAALPWRVKAGDVLEAAKKSTDRLGRPIDLCAHATLPWPRCACHAPTADLARPECHAATATLRSC